jgi:hypothetical protein
MLARMVWTRSSHTLALVFAESDRGRKEMFCFNGVNGMDIGKGINSTLCVERKDLAFHMRSAL